MEWALGTGAIVGMFLLRLIVPLVITLTLGYALRRLDAKWHPEEKGKSDIGARSCAPITEGIPPVGASHSGSLGL